MIARVEDYRIPFCYLTRYLTRLCGLTQNQTYENPPAALSTTGESVEYW